MGSSFATTSRDKDVRIVDASSMTVTNMIKTAHDGNKSAKLTYCGTYIPLSLSLSLSLYVYIYIIYLY